MSAAALTAKLRQLYSGAAGQSFVDRVCPLAVSRLASAIGNPLRLADGERVPPVTETSAS